MVAAAEKRKLNRRVSSYLSAAHPSSPPLRLFNAGGKTHPVLPLGRRFIHGKSVTNREQNRNYVFVNCTYLSLSCFTKSRQGAVDTPLARSPRIGLASRIGYAVHSPLFIDTYGGYDVPGSHRFRWFFYGLKIQFCVNSRTRPSQRTFFDLLHPTRVFYENQKTSTSPLSIVRCL